ncbi:hypothetical protein [Flavobacterium reichenbachii]|uniref:hypothetical protein n=1 Tax=Flavobacterium reichenbachii TaxID=362418 RepID=UPI00068A0B95|nr:hypothetical protein [Flavobacterium reichenbachii]OXB12785.1 hypothetical protein B0A68_18540 [Flavobacterium reichenbachii]
MKKYASLLLFALLLNGCDDGDLVVDTIDFASVEPASCGIPTGTTSGNSLIYKLKDREAFLLQMPIGSGLIENDSTYTYDINNTSYRLLYRAYDGAVATDNLCSTIPPSTPKVTEEWIATGGKIKIQSTTTIGDGPIEGSTRVTGYSHTIFLNDITFLRPSGSQTNEQYNFGTYKTTITPANLTFNDINVAYNCAERKEIYNYNNSFYIMIENISDDMLVNVETETGKPRTYDITTSGNNKVFYRTAEAGSGTITNNYFCPTRATTPTIGEEWKGLPVYENVKGTIEVTTTKNAQIYFHAIVLRNVVVQKENSKFKLGNNFVLGTITKTAQ